ncbi:MAG TPA: nucleotidyltransferase domain-containing protein [Ktedonobacterales bacterium]|jgi:nucleotidyltransferase-like protein|nr:nucleotidyltransferase domain-containing protein [Ktedonobacterales bacterium]
MSGLPEQLHADLRLDNLPPLPQSQAIRMLVPKLWQNEQVVAIWLGGSLAAGTGDPYSDIDLRVAVPPEVLSDWEASDLHTILDGPALARQLVKLGDSAFIHHMILQGGDILDLLVQSSEAAPGNEPVLILGCRDDALAKRLASSDQTPEAARTPVTSEAVRELVVAFWVNSHKHRKVLHRGLDLMFPAASYANWYMLMRMWYIDATSCDTSSYHFSGIHGLTELVHAVESVNGMEPLTLCGAPTQTREEICDAIERYQETVSLLGRRLAERYGFEYPAELENIVRRDWKAFRAMA